MFTWWRLHDVEMLSSTSNKTKLLVKNFSENSNLDESGIFLPVFPSRTNLKLHHISKTPKIVKKVIMDLDSSKAPGPDCISVVVLNSCGLNVHIYYLNTSMCVWKNLVFQIVGRSHWWSLYLRMLEKSLLLKTTTLIVFFLWLFKSLKNL